MLRALSISFSSLSLLSFVSQLLVPFSFIPLSFSLGYDLRAFRAVSRDICCTLLLCLSPFTVPIPLFSVPHLAGRFLSTFFTLCKSQAFPTASVYSQL